MMLKRVMILSVLLIASTCIAGERTGGTRRSSDVRRTANADVSRSARSDTSQIPGGNAPIDLFDATTRRPVPKKSSNELFLPPKAAAAMTIKFMDYVKARVSPDGIKSLTSTDITSAQDLIKRFNLRVESAFSQDPADLLLLEQKAFRGSGKAQPDLNGILRITGPRGVMTRVARMLNDMEYVEYVEFEKPLIELNTMFIDSCCIQSAAGAPLVCAEISLADCISLNGLPHAGVGCNDLNADGFADICVGACCTVDALSAPLCVNNSTPIDCTGIQGGSFEGAGTECVANGGAIDCATRGACCFDLTDACDNFDAATCASMGGRFTTVGTNCGTPNICDAPSCGDITAGKCMVPTPFPAFLGGTNSPFCELATCCAAVCQIDPDCCDDNALGPRDWDEDCALIANFFRVSGFQNDCFGSAPAASGPCLVSIQDCFIASGTDEGCNISSCCFSVCSVDPDCCDSTLSWDADCVALANAMCSTVSFGTTPDFFARGVQGYLTASSWANNLPEDMVSGIVWPACDSRTNLATFIPTTFSMISSLPPFKVRSGFTGEGFDLAGMETVSSILNSFGVGDNTDPAKGKGIRLGLLDSSAYIQNNVALVIHEDLAGRVTLIPPTATLLPAPLADPDHGTAMLGIMGANPDNGIGMVGMAPLSDLYFFPSRTLEFGGRRLSALADVGVTFDEGDVLVIGEGEPDCGNILSLLSEWTMVRTLTDAGIIVVTGAGNGACNLLQQPHAGDDSGAIVCGANTPGIPYTRLGFSNFCNDCQEVDGDIIHVSAWGVAVATLGFGDLWDNGDSSSYTNSFSGTSAASAQIGALAARLQGISKQFYGIPLSPAQLRNSNTAGLTAFGLMHPNNLFDQDGRVRAFGTPPGTECLGDHSPTEDPNNIGGFPLAANMAAWIISGPHFSTGEVPIDIQVIRGKMIRGNRFSLAGEDRNYAMFESQYTRRGTPGPDTDRAARAVTYLGTGQISDIIVDLDSTDVSLDDLAITHIHASESNPLTATIIGIIEAYDFSSRRWDFANLVFETTGDVTDTSGSLYLPQRFVQSGSNLVKVRLYTLGLGGGSSSGIANGSSLSHIIRYDFVGITTAPRPVGPVSPGVIDP